MKIGKQGAESNTNERTLKDKIKTKKRNKALDGTDTRTNSIKLFWYGRDKWSQQGIPLITDVTQGSQITQRM